MTAPAAPKSIPPEVLEAWSTLSQGEVSPLGTGLINETFLVVGSRRPKARGLGARGPGAQRLSAESRLVVQRLHPTFDGRVNLDLDDITTRLAAKGVVTPRLQKADDGRATIEDAAGNLWRALTFIEGHAFDRFPSLQHAAEAGRLVARFHLNLASEDLAFQKSARNVHDTVSHLRLLESSLVDHREHRLYDEVAPIADALLRAADPLPDFSSLPLRTCHGDLKGSNLMFDDEGKGLCLVDLDTIAPMRWPHEMGDAFRSWCNLGGEDQTEVAFDLPTFRAALEGYAESAGNFLKPEERAALVDGIGIICLELAARFLADVLRESYFGWDPGRFASRSDHNLVRARGQWALCRDLERQRAQAEAIVGAAFR